ncbi:MAG: ribonuclease HII [Candidatus Pacearchaeota archaeon]
MYQKMKIYLGFDDSGRGPVIGPMIIGGVAVNEEQNSFLKKIGVKDSKLLSPNTRERLAKQIKEHCLAYTLVKTYPEEIDSREKMKINLNKLEAIKFAKAITQLWRKLCFQAKESIEESPMFVFIVDCPSNNIPKWRALLESYLPDELRDLIKQRKIALLVKHKAERHTSVAAASILAKEEREYEITKVKALIDYDFGSGYPSDPRTRYFLEKIYPSPKLKALDEKLKFVRKSWATYKKQSKQKQSKEQNQGLEQSEQSKQKKLTDF